MNTVKINNFLKKKNYLIYFLTLGFFFLIYSLTVGQIKSYNDSKKRSFDTFLTSNEFSNIKEFILENLNSPYKEYNHTVENNDTIEKILKKYNINTEDVNKIASAVVKKGLSNIFAKTKIEIVVKEDSGSNKVVSLFYPINELTTIEIKEIKISLLLMKIF